MHGYDLKKIDKCFVCGNIDRNIERFIHRITSNLSNYQKVEHPKEIERQQRLKARVENDVIDSLRNTLRRPKKWSPSSRKTYNDSVIFVSGNCGIGSKSLEHYQKMFGELDKILKDNNCFIFFVRGNNDDPSIFQEEKINLENVKTVPDYSVVLLKNFNCLCIGGSVSLDKEWKEAQEETFGKKLYWEGEEPFFDEKELDEILHNFKIGCVISSTSPTFTYPGTNSFNRSRWIKGNSPIKGLLAKERKTMDKIYDKMLDMDSKPYVWSYGRFKQYNPNKINDIVFESLAAFQIEDVCSLIINHFGIDASKKLGGNEFSLDGFLQGAIPQAHILEEEPIDELEDDLDEFENEINEEGEGIEEEPRIGDAAQDLELVGNNPRVFEYNRAIDSIRYEHPQASDVIVGTTATLGNTIITSAIDAYPYNLYAADYNAYNPLTTDRNANTI